MPRRPVVLLGTGTGVGKTYVGERLLRALASAGHQATGYKPVESGLPDASPESDGARLASASSFHPEPPLYRVTFAAPVSPHLAAALEHSTIDLHRIRTEIRRGIATGTQLVVEFPGGAFSPLTEALSAADFLRDFPNALLVLVAPDRIGVLHDLRATDLACSTLGLQIDAVVFSAPESADASTGTNPREARLVTRLPIITTLPRLPATHPVASGDPIWPLAHRLLGQS